MWHTPYSVKAELKLPIVLIGFQVEIEKENEEMTEYLR